LGKARLIPVRETVVHPIAQDFPFQLIQRPSLFRSGLLSLKSDTLKKVSEEPHLEMNPEDAQRLKIEEGEVVKVSTPMGLPLRMKVKYSSKLASQVITAPYPCSLVDEGGIASIKIERLNRSSC
jgi:anaerobic selenocysteine-containing dehydrogenase